MRFRLGLLVCVATLISLIGCGKRAESIKEPPPATGVRASRVTGRVAWKGEFPAEKLLAAYGDEEIDRIRGGEPMYTEYCIVSAQGGLANAFVFVKGTPDVAIPAPPDTPVVLRAEKGIYSPHVIALRVGQTLQIGFSKDEKHNPHPVSKLSAEFGVERLPENPREYKFKHQEIFRVKCDVHGWMLAHAGVFNHPWFAVTGPDGSFELAGLPPGKYRLKAWHEKGGEREADIEIGGNGDDVRAEFEFGPE